MKWIKKLLGFKEKEEDKESSVEVSEVAEHNENLNISNEEKCDYCGLSIYGDQRMIHKNGKKFHLKPCWRQLNKEVRKL